MKGDNTGGARPRPAGARKPGAKPKPTALKLRDNVDGTRLHRTPLPGEEPKPKVKRVSPPPILDQRARAEWDVMAKELFDNGLLTTLDRATLAAYCQSWSMWAQAVELLQSMAERDELSKGLMIKTSNKNVIQNPVVGIINKAASQMVRFATEFGMTPSARSRIALTDQLAENMSHEDALTQIELRIQAGKKIIDDDDARLPLRVVGGTDKA